MKKYRLNSSGVTLIELLATLAIVGIIAGLAFSIFFQGLSSYERIKMEAELRDEADVIMSNFIKNIFTLKESEIDSLTTVCSNNSPNSYIKLSENGISYNTGFFNNQILINNVPIILQSNKVSLVPNICNGVPSNLHNYITEIASPYGKEYTVHFTLTTTLRGTERQLKFVNTIQVIND